MYEGDTAEWSCSSLFYVVGKFADFQDGLIDASMVKQCCASSVIWLDIIRIC